MLKDFDVKKTEDKKALGEGISALRKQLLTLQQEAKEKKLPVLVLKLLQQQWAQLWLPVSCGLELSMPFTVSQSL